MKILIYYLLLLVFIGLIAGFLLFGHANAMGMNQMVGAAAGLVLYTIAASLVGETGAQDERDVLHKNLANRAGLIAGTVIFSLGILYGLFVRHEIDYWLLAGLIAINLTKIVSLIFLNYKK